MSGVQTLRAPEDARFILRQHPANPL